MDISTKCSSKPSYYGENSVQRKRLLTALICLCFTTYGAGCSLIGPTLIDITHLLGSTIELVSYGFVARQISFLSGSLFYGWLYGRVNRQLGFALNLMAVGFCIFAIPRLTCLTQFIAVQLAMGFAVAGMEVASSAWLLEMWRQDSNPYLQCMHFFFALGTVASPLISVPYLSPEVAADSKILPPGVDTTSQIHIPYTMCSAFILLAALVQLTVFWWSPYRQVKQANLIDSTKALNSSADKAALLPMAESKCNLNSHVTENYLRTLVVVGGLILSFDVVVEAGSNTYLQAFVVNIDLHLTKSKGAFMTSALSSAFTIGRLVGIFLATKLRPATMICFDFALVLIGNLILLTYANTSENGLWYGLVVLGFGYASCYPAIYAFIEERICITDMISGTFLFLSSIGFTIEPMIAGRFIERSPLIFVHINLVCVTMCILLFVYVNYAKSLRYNSRIKLI